jgi:hypothetical protein
VLLHTGGACLTGIQIWLTLRDEATVAFDGIHLALHASTTACGFGKYAQK